MAAPALDPVLALRGAGLRVTGPRVATLRVLDASPHVAADEIASAVRRDLGTVSTQAVYDVLRALADAGLVRRIEPAGSSARYETRAGDNHHHLVCRICGAIEDVDCAVDVVPCLTPSERHGYEVDEAEVIYWGTCPACRAAATAALAPVAALRTPPAPPPSPSDPRSTTRETTP